MNAFKGVGRSYLKYVIVAITMVFTWESAFSQAVQTQKDKNKITYRSIKAEKAYKRPSSQSHINIKITPPKTMGAKSYVLVEIYNNSSLYVAAVDFDMTLNNKAGYDIVSHVNCVDMLPGRSSLRMISANGKGEFPPLDGVTLDHLQMLDAKAGKVGVPVFVDLVKP